MSLRDQIPDAITAMAQREVQRMVCELQGVMSAVVSTSDGFEVASATSGKVDAIRVSAMSSSIVAISNAVTDETRLGRAKSVVIQAHSGFAVLCGVPRDDIELVVNILADVEAVLALSLYRASEVAKRLAQA